MDANGPTVRGHAGYAPRGVDRPRKLEALHHGVVGTHRRGAIRELKRTFELGFTGIQLDRKGCRLVMRADGHLQIMSSNL